MVERHLAKVEVAGSNPVIRSKNPDRFYDPDFLSAQYAVCANGQLKASPRKARVAHSLASFPSYFKKILVCSLHYSLRIFVSSDEKSDCAIAPSELRGDALNKIRS